MRFTFTALIFSIIMPGMSLFGQLQINEVNALNTTGLNNPLAGQSGDWIEIYNSSSTPVPMGSYHLTDNPANLFKWRFPQSAEVPAEGYLLLWADGTGDTLNGIHTNFKLDVAGETLLLHSAVRLDVDSLTYPRMYENTSYGISSDGNPAFFSNPTPGTTNDQASAYQLAGEVHFEPAAGLYPTGTRVYFSTDDPGGTIRYTLDGSPPDISDPIYTGSIAINSNRVIRARQWVDGSEPGEITTASYITTTGLTLPVVSLSTDPDNLWDDQIGIYVVGTNGIPGYCTDQNRNWNQPWERPVSMEYIDTQGAVQFQIDGGMKIHGGCSRQFPLKSLGIFARNEYGDNSMDYRFFREKDIDLFKGLILRNAGNDFGNTYLIDAVIQESVARVMDIDYQAYEPVDMFLNGAYWGIHNLREKANEHWVTSNYGIPAENLDFIKNGSEVFAGTRTAYDNLKRYLEQNSLESDNKYNVVANQIDIDSYIDYLITQLYYANHDWPGNNQKCWRDRVNGGKWRWILFDTEFGLGLYDFNPAKDMFSFATLPNGTGWPNPAWSTLQIRRLLENEGFRNQFIQTYMMHLNTTFKSERVIGVIDSLYNNIQAAFPAHIDRWNQPGSMADWAQRVARLRQYATQRPDNVWNNMRNFFSLGSVVELRIDSTTHGEVIVNNVSVPREGLVGKYITATELNLEYHPDPGYRLLHWEVTTGGLYDTILLPRNSVWRYNDTGTYPGDAWKESSFNDASWPSGAGELGYGDGGESTVLEYGGDDQNKYTSYYFRTTIEVADPSLFDRYKIRLMRDDGAVIYVNGTEILRDNMPAGDILPGTFATTFVGDGGETTYFVYTLDGQLLQPGINTIAVEIHQTSLTSSDISFDLEMEGGIRLESETYTVEGNPVVLHPEGGITITPVTETVQLDLQLFINEFMALNQGAWFDETGNDGDWIEIYNPGDADVDMAGLYFTDSLEFPTKWRIPYGSPEVTTVAASDWLVFFADDNQSAGPLHLDFRMDAAGEKIGLSYLSGNSTVWIDTISYGPQLMNISSGRYPDGTSNWIAMEQYTPGESNVMTDTSTAILHRQVLEVSLFPNPVSDILNIRIRSVGGDHPDEITLHLYDLTGRALMQHRSTQWGGTTEEQLDLSQLENGVYMMVIETGAGVHTRRFIKT
ncbi:MAG: CotH kinase family protein, partial [Bacteroidota bacterium]